MNLYLMLQSAKTAQQDKNNDATINKILGSVRQ